MYWSMLGRPVCDDLSDCGPFFDLEYGLDGVFDQSPEYVDESVIRRLTLRMLVSLIPSGLEAS